MKGTIYDATLYSNFLENLMLKPVGYLQDKIQDLNNKFSEKSNCIAYGMEIKAAKDLMDARKYPQGETAQRINFNKNGN